MNYYNEIKNDLLNNEINKSAKNYSINKCDLTAYYNVGKCFLSSEYQIKMDNRYNFIDLLLFNVVELKVTEFKKIKSK